VAIFHPSRASAALALAGLILCPSPANGGDPTRKWRTIETPHFQVHYYRSDRHDEGAVAQHVAHTAERVHAIMVPLLKHEPSGKVDIVVTDDTDGANGSAQVVPRNVVRIFVTGPTSFSSLNDYDDWLFGLLLHEYTHILHIDTIHGVARLINYVLGKTWAPNQVQPRWFIEGLATYYESARSSGGRIRSSIYDMYLRMAVLQGKLLELDQMSSITRYFPRGDVPYLYGSRFLDYLARRFGAEKLTRISHDYGGQPLPYAINRTAKRILGHTFIELYEQFKEHLRRRYQVQRLGVVRQGRTPFTEVTDYGESCGTPRFSSDGKELVFIDTDGRSEFAVKVLDTASGRIVQRFEIRGGSGADFTPDARYIVYGGAAMWRTVYNFHDLYVRNRASGKVRRLTDGLRARDPAVSPRGDRVAFTTNELGTMSLRVVPFDGGAARVLIKGGNGEQFYTPRWSPDGASLVYSRWRPGGYRDIEQLHLPSGQVRRLTDDRALDMDPTYSADGRRVYFSSDRTGIFNLYSHELATGRLSQVTNVLGGAFTPAVSPAEDRAYFVSFSARGYDLASMRLDRARYRPAAPYVDDRPQPVKTAPPDEPYPERPYSALHSILPDAWSLLLGIDAYGSTIGFRLQGSDLVGDHYYLLNMNFSTVNGRPNYSVFYDYRHFWPDIHLETGRYEGPRGGLSVDGKRLTYVEEGYNAGLTVNLPLLRMPGHSGDVKVGYRFNYFRHADEPDMLVLPGDISPELPRTGLLSGISLGMSYRSTQRYGHSISTEKGRVIALNLWVNHEVFGSEYQSTALSWAWTEYVPIPWLDDHVFALRYAGGIGAGDLARRGVFSVGGFPEQDLLLTLFDPLNRPGGAFLRGYKPGLVYGEQYHLINLEYRFPVLEVQKGIASLPIFLSHVHAAVFVDFGDAFFGDFDPQNLKVGVGGELLVELIIGYFVPSTFRIGYARGLMEPGGNEFHFWLGQPF